MKTRNIIAAALAAFTAQQTATAATIVGFTFDDTANDTGPAWQEFTNNSSSTQDITDGTIANSSTQGSGFVSVTSVDLSGFEGFTVNIVVESTNFDTSTGGGFNGSFFGIATGPDAGGTGGSTLWNNVGTATKPAIGLQFGDNGRGTAGQIELVVNPGTAAYTTLLAYPTTAMNDGFTLSLTFTDNGASDAGISIASTGLGGNIDFTGTISGFAYGDFANTVHGNVSSQGGSVDLASYTITTVPEPSSTALLGLGGLAILMRRRRVK